MSADMKVVEAENSAKIDVGSKSQQKPTPVRMESIEANVSNQSDTESRWNVLKRIFFRNVSNQQKTYNERMVYEKSNDIGPTCHLPFLNTTEKKFSRRSKLYVGNLPDDVNENEFVQLFQSYGDTSEVFIYKDKNFGFIRMDYHHNAKKAKFELNGTVFKGKALNVRLVPNPAIIKARNLDECVTNELLLLAFSIFGEVDRSVVVTDAYGKSTGVGIVEFSKRSSSNLALSKCREGCFFLTSSLRPIIAEAYEVFDDEDGFSEKFLSTKSSRYYMARCVGPRFAAKDSFEYEYAMRWKHTDELFTRKIEALKKAKEIAEKRLLAQIELARAERKVALMREKFNLHQINIEMYKREWKLEQQRRAAIRREEDIQARAIFQGQLRRQTEQNLPFIKIEPHQDDIIKREVNLEVERNAIVCAGYIHYISGLYGGSNAGNYWKDEGVERTSKKRRRY